MDKGIFISSFAMRMPFISFFGIIVLIGTSSISLNKSDKIGILALFLILGENHSIFLFFKILFLAALGLRCCAWAFSSCGKQGLLFVVVYGLLTWVASLVAEHGL